MRTWAALAGRRDHKSGRKPNGWREVDTIPQAGRRSILKKLLTGFGFRRIKCGQDFQVARFVYSWSPINGTSVVIFTFLDFHAHRALAHFNTFLGT
jgi:hypothetical protein